MRKVVEVSSVSVTLRRRTLAALQHIIQYVRDEFRDALIPALRLERNLDRLLLLPCRCLKFGAV
jgi:hypothetical protein